MTVRIVSKTPMHTPENVEGYLVDALAIADAALLSPEDRATLLPTIVTLLSQHLIEQEQTAPGLSIAQFGKLPQRG